MKINIGKNDICYTCQQGKKIECDAGVDDVFIDDIGYICDCKCYQSKKKKTVIPDEILSEFKDFKEMRIKRKKPLTERAVTRLLNRLEELAPGNYEAQREMLLNAVDHCWDTVYPLKENNSSPTHQCSNPFLGIANDEGLI